MAERTHRKPAALVDAIVALKGFVNANDEQPGKCRVCAEPVAKGRRYYCGSDHARAFSNAMMWTPQTFALVRAGGVCECGCGLDTNKLIAERAAAGAVPAYKSWHLRHLIESAEALRQRAEKAAQDAATRAAVEAILEEWGASQDRTELLDVDHKVPFEVWPHDPIECNHPDNLQALAIPCHKRKTARQAAQRARTKRKQEGRAHFEATLREKAGQP